MGTIIFYIIAWIMTGITAGLVIINIIAAAVYGEWWFKYVFFIVGWIAVYVLWRVYI